MRWTNAGSRRERVFIENIPTIDSFIWSIFGSSGYFGRIKRGRSKIGSGIGLKDSFASSGWAEEKLRILCFSPLFEPPPESGGGGRARVETLVRSVSKEPQEGGKSQSEERKKQVVRQSETQCLAPFSYINTDLDGNANCPSSISPSLSLSFFPPLEPLSAVVVYVCNLQIG